MRRSAGKNACSAGSMSATSSSRLGAPGRVRIAPPGAIRAVSSTKVESGWRGSAGSRVEREPARDERLAVALVLGERLLEVGNAEVDGRQPVGEVLRGEAHDGASEHADKLSGLDAGTAWTSLRRPSATIPRSARAEDQPAPSRRRRRRTLRLASRCPHPRGQQSAPARPPFGRSGGRAGGPPRRQALPSRAPPVVPAGRPETHVLRGARMREPVRARSRAPGTTSRPRCTGSLPATGCACERARTAPSRSTSRAPTGTESQPIQLVFDAKATLEPREGSPAIDRRPARTGSSWARTRSSAGPRRREFSSGDAARTTCGSRAPRLAGGSGPGIRVEAEAARVEITSAYRLEDAPHADGRQLVRRRHRGRRARGDRRGRPVREQSLGLDPRARSGGGPDRRTGRADPREHDAERRRDRDLDRGGRRHHDREQHPVSTRRAPTRPAASRSRRSSGLRCAAIAYRDSRSESRSATPSRAPVPSAPPPTCRSSGIFFRASEAVRAAFVVEAGTRDPHPQQPLGRIRRTACCSSERRRRRSTSSWRTTCSCASRTSRS